MYFLLVQTLTIFSTSSISSLFPGDFIGPFLLSVTSTKNSNWKGNTLKDYYYELAKLGGFLARKSDGGPGFITTWRGYLKLQDIIFGFRLI